MKKAPSHTRPKLSYSSAMHHVLTLPGGTTVSVRECSKSDFIALLRAALRDRADQEAIKLEIRGCQFDNAVDRWFCLNVLSQHGITV